MSKNVTKGDLLKGIVTNFQLQWGMRSVRLGLKTHDVPIPKSDPGYQSAGTKVDFFAMEVFFFKVEIFVSRFLFKGFSVENACCKLVPKGEPLKRPFPPLKSFSSTSQTQLQKLVCIEAW